ncbi:10231_t:CDS:2, partial [Ambispora gerdemannii]
MLRRYQENLVMYLLSSISITVQKCCQKTITFQDVTNIQMLLCNFVEFTRLPAFTITFHYILHVAEFIQKCGPCWTSWTSWQFPIERLIGILQPM